MAVLPQLAESGYWSQQQGLCVLISAASLGWRHWPMLDVYLAWAFERMTASHNVHTGQMSPPEEGCGAQHVSKWS